MVRENSCNRFIIINIRTTIGSNPIITAKQTNNKTIRIDNLIVLEVPSLILSNNMKYNFTLDENPTLNKVLYGMIIMMLMFNLYLHFS